MPAVTLPPPRLRHCNPRRILHYFQMPPRVLWFLVEKHLGCLAGTYWTHTARSALCPGCKAKSQVSKFLPYSIGTNWHWEFIPFFHRGIVDFWRSNIMSFNCDHHPTWHMKGHRILTDRQGLFVQISVFLVSGLWQEPIIPFEEPVVASGSNSNPTRMQRLTRF